MYYPCSENKGADQLQGNSEADLRLCFSHMQIVGFLMRWLIRCSMWLTTCISCSYLQKTIKPLASYEASDRLIYEFVKIF